MYRKDKHGIYGYDHSLEEQRKIDSDEREDKAMFWIFVTAAICSILPALSLFGVI